MPRDTVPMSHIGLGTYVAPSGPASVPVSQWPRYICRSKSTNRTHPMVSLGLSPAKDGLPMLLVVSVVEQRYRAGLEVLESDAMG